MELRSSIEGDWLEVTPVVVGGAFCAGGTADRFVVLDDARRGKIRLDVFRGPDEICAFEEVRAVEHGLLVGFGHHVHFVDLEDLVATTHDLDSYFGSVTEFDDTLFVSSCERVFRFTKEGELLWRSHVVGVDGVLVQGVEDGRVRGTGEWDPPGGWQPFVLSLDTGAEAT